MSPAPHLSALIPFRDKAELLNKCLESLGNFALSNTISTEIILLNNQSTPEALSTLRIPASLKASTRILDCNYSFNFQKMINEGARAAEGQVLWILNNDIEFTPLSTGLVEKACTLALKPQAGAIGHLLLYPDGSLQHAGVVVGMDSYAEHLYREWREDEVLKHGFVSHKSSREVSAVTAASLFVERKKFESIGGFNENFIVCGGDVDFCLRLRYQEKTNYYIGSHSAVHAESKSRKHLRIPNVDFIESRKSYDQFLQLHGGRDPFYPRSWKETHLWKPSSQKTFFSKIFGQWRHLLSEEGLSSLFKWPLRILKRLLGARDVLVFEPIPARIRYIHYTSLEQPKTFVLLPHLNEAKSFAGLKTIIDYFLEKSKGGESVTFITTDEAPLASSLSKLLPEKSKIEVINGSSQNPIEICIGDDDHIVATAWWTKIMLDRSTINPSKVTYFVQDDESLFYRPENSTSQRMARQSYNNISNAIVNSLPLKNHLELTYSIRPTKLEVLDPIPADIFFKANQSDFKIRPKNIFIYWRPSVRRNLASLCKKALESQEINFDGWTIHLGGEDCSLSLSPNGGSVMQHGRMPIAEYANLLGQSKIAICLMDCPHPSLPPLEAKAAGCQVLALYFNSLDRYSLSQGSGQITQVKNDEKSLLLHLKELIECTN